MSPRDARLLLTQRLESTSDGGRSHDLTIALARLDAGEWGSCAACRTEIATDRLRADPTATHCESCDVVVLDGQFTSGAWQVPPAARTPSVA